MTNGTTPAPMTGLELKLRRIVRGATATAIAKELGVARQLVTTWESTLRPTTAACERYLEALERVERRRAKAAEAAEPEPEPVGATQR